MGRIKDRKGLHVLPSRPSFVRSLCLLRPTTLVLVLVLSFVAPAHPQNDSSLDSNEITRETIIEQMNLRRKEHHLAPFRGDDRLHRAATDRMDDMTRNGYWGHDPPDGGSPFIWMRLRGYKYAVAGENLAVGLESADVLVNAWMGSPGHRENILSPDFRDVGVAFIEGGTTRRRAGKSVVVLFAREREVPAPRR